jgi:hypothetical protein
MAQPRGRALNFEARYWTYLRCSPVFCFVDCVSIIIRLVTYGSSVLWISGIRIPLRERLQLVIRNRFAEPDQDDPEEGVREVRRVTWLRWLFFIFGALTSSLKLMSFIGTPWTQTWGDVFTFSFLLFEILAILSWMGGRQRRPCHDAADTAKLKPIEAWLDAFDKQLFQWASDCHGLLLLWVVGELWPNIDNKVSDEFRGGTSHPLMKPFLKASVLMSKFGVGTGFCAWLFTPFLVGSSLWQNESRLKAVFYTFLSLIPVSIIELAVLSTAGFDKSLVVDIGYFLGVAMPAPALNVMLAILCRRYRTVAENLMLGSIDEQGNSAHPVDPVGLLVLVSFLYTVVLCTIWYAFRYDSSGTVNPSWTGVFGRGHCISMNCTDISPTTSSHACHIWMPEASFTHAPPVTVPKPHF